MHEKFDELNELYKRALPEEQKLLPWDLHVTTIKEVVLYLMHALMLMILTGCCWCSLACWFQSCSCNVSKLLFQYWTEI